MRNGWVANLASAQIMSCTRAFRSRTSATTDEKSGGIRAGSFNYLRGFVGRSSSASAERMALTTTSFLDDPDAGVVVQKVPVLHQRCSSMVPDSNRITTSQVPWNGPF